MSKNYIFPKTFWVRKTYNLAKDGVFKLFSNSNIKIVKCFFNFFNRPLKKVYGFFFYLVITAGYSIALYILSRGLDTLILMRNMPKVIMNDCIDINILKSIYRPELVGVGDDNILDNIYIINQNSRKNIELGIIEEEKEEEVKIIKK